MNLGQAQANHKRKIVLIGLPLLTICAVALLAGVSLLGQNSSPKVTNYVIFEVRPFSSNETSTISVDVRLDDGMDKDEALTVASNVFALCILDVVPKAPKLSFGVTAGMSESGIWTVEMNSAYSGDFHCSRFLYTGTIRERVTATINPMERTVVYTTCSPL